MSNLIEMKNARILYNEKLNEATRKYEISDLVVAEFNLDDFQEAERHGEIGSSVWPMHLYRENTPNYGSGYNKDFGNCFLTTWHLWKPVDIIIDLFITHDFVSDEVKNKVFTEIMKIKEVNEVILEFRKKRIF